MASGKATTKAINNGLIGQMEEKFIGLPILGLRGIARTVDYVFVVTIKRTNTTC